MALVKCKECGTEMSDSASACPKCGGLNNTVVYGKIAGVILGAIIGYFLLR